MTEGGSLYWVVKGNVQCCQLLLEIMTFVNPEGIGLCCMLLESTVICNEWQPRLAFHGWYYLKPAEASVNLSQGNSALTEMSPTLRMKLAELGLL